jgi:hypothetical protein
VTPETIRIDDELRRAYETDAWHGSSFREILSGVTAEVAARKHPALAHSIWTLVKHVSVWVDVIRRRLVEWRPVDADEADNFPAITDTSPAAWNATLAEFDHRYADLRAAVRAFDPARLGETVPGKDYPVPVMLHGTAQHLAYHGGQIAVLNKLLA